MPELSIIIPAAAIVVAVVGAIALNSAHRDRSRPVPVRVVANDDLQARRQRYLASTLPAPRPDRRPDLPVGPGREGFDAVNALRHRLADLPDAA